MCFAVIVTRLPDTVGRQEIDMALLGGDSLPPTSSLVAAAFGSLVSTPVYTSQEYQALLRRDPDMAENAQKLDMAQMYEHTLVWGQLGDESRGGGAR